MAHNVLSLRSSFTGQLACRFTALPENLETNEKANFAQMAIAGIDLMSIDDGVFP